MSIEEKPASPKAWIVGEVERRQIRDLAHEEIEAGKKGLAPSEKYRKEMETWITGTAAGLVASLGLNALFPGPFALAMLGVSLTPALVVASEWLFNKPVASGSAFDSVESAANVAKWIQDDPCAKNEGGAVSGSREYTFLDEKTETAFEKVIERVRAKTSARGEASASESKPPVRPAI